MFSFVHIHTSVRAYTLSPTPAVWPGSRGFPLSPLYCGWYTKCAVSFLLQDYKNVIQNHNNQILAAYYGWVATDHSFSRNIFWVIGFKVTLKWPIMLEFNHGIKKFHNMLKGKELHVINKVTDTHSGKVTGWRISSEFLEMILGCSFCLFKKTKPQSHNGLFRKKFTTK